MRDEGPANRKDGETVRSPGRRMARSRQVQRLMDQGPRVSGRTWLHLIVLVGVLVLLFATRDEFGRKAAGCYGRVAGEQPQVPMGSDGALAEPPVERGVSETLPTPAVRLAPP